MCNGAPCNKTRSLRIEGEMTIYRATDAKRSLFSALDDACMIELDLSDVTEIDTAGVQLIMLAKIMAEAKGGSLSLAQCSARVTEVIGLLDLGDYFRNVSVAPGEMPVGCSARERSEYAA